MEEMQITSDLTWIEVQFMKKAVDEVEKCRMTLKWTYAMAYYLDKGNEKELFEDNQRLVVFGLLIWFSVECSFIFA
jgi:ariadne-1